MKIFFFEDEGGTLDGFKCHEIAFYFLMKSRGTKELNSNSYTLGVKEYMHWLPVNKLKEYIAYPSFFADKLLNLKEIVEHVVTVE